MCVCVASFFLSFFVWFHFSRAPRFIRVFLCAITIWLVWSPDWLHFPISKIYSITVFYLVLLVCYWCLVLSLIILFILHIFCLLVSVYVREWVSESVWVCVFGCLICVINLSWFAELYAMYKDGACQLAFLLIFTVSSYFYFENIRLLNHFI